MNTVETLLKANDGASLETATVPEVYRAVSRAAMADIYGTWESCKKSSKKRVGYLSAEFLVGRAVFSNLYNLGILGEVRDWMKERGFDIASFEEIEDAALGNGGLGRLAACYLESGATVSIPLDGYGIRYRYGLFRQEFENGFQREAADDWQRCGDPWSYRREDESVLVEFSDFAVRAVPYDMPVIGYGGATVNTLRLWQSEAPGKFDFAAFDAKSNSARAQIVGVCHMYYEQLVIKNLIFLHCKDFRRRQWHPTPVLLPGKSHGRRSLVGCSPWGREESDTTE